MIYNQGNESRGLKSTYNFVFTPVVPEIAGSDACMRKGFIEIKYH